MAATGQSRRGSPRAIINLLLIVLLGIFTAIGAILTLPGLPIVYQGYNIDLRYFVLAAVVIVIASLIIFYIRLFERENGVSVLGSPTIEQIIDSKDKSAIEDAIYSVSRQLASLFETVRAGERYVLGTSLDDRSPRSISLSLRFYRYGSSSTTPSKSAYCFITFDDMVLSLSCGFFGNRIPFERLEDALRTEFRLRNIGLGKMLVERRPR